MWFAAASTSNTFQTLFAAVQQEIVLNVHERTHGLYSCRKALYAASLAATLCVVASAPANATREGSKSGESPPVVVVDSPHDLEKTVTNVVRAAKGANLRYVGRRFVDEGLVAQGEEDRHRVTVLVCDSALLADSLALNKRLGTFLPCHINVVEHAGAVKVITLNPDVLKKAFFADDPELHDVFRSLSDLYAGILEEVTL